MRDRTARKEFKVEPRQFDGRLQHGLPDTDNVYLELYLSEPKPGNQIGLYRAGTCVFQSITDLDRFAHAPWNSQYLQGIIDAPDLNLTPGTRLGVIYDEKLNALEEALKLKQSGHPEQGGAVAIIDGAKAIYAGVRDGNVEQAVVVTVKAGAGTAMLAGVADSEPRIGCWWCRCLCWRCCVRKS